MERERKFISPAAEARRLLDPEVPGTHITQWYLSPSGSEHELRVRKSTDAQGEVRHQATLKTGHGLERGETEVDITESAALLLQRAAVAVISKTRHQLDKAQGLTLDTFQTGSMRFYSLLEIEQQDGQPDVLTFTPESLGINSLMEVTGHRYASNRHIAIDLPTPEIPKGQSIEQITEKIYNLMRTSSRPIIAAFSGPSASGKSTVMRNIESYLGDQAVTISTDDYYKGHTRMKQELSHEHADNFDHPGAIDIGELASHLESLRDGKSIRRPTYSMETGERTGEYVFVHPAPVILLEGLVANHPILKELASITTMIHASPGTRLARRMQRDVARAGWAQEKSMAYVMNTAEPAYIEWHQENDMQADYSITTEP